MKKKKTLILMIAIGLIYIVIILSAGDVGDGSAGASKFVGRIEPHAGGAGDGAGGTAEFHGLIEPHAGDLGDGAAGTAEFDDLIEPHAGDAGDGAAGTAKFVGRIEPHAGGATAAGTVEFDGLIVPHLVVEVGSSVAGVLKSVSVDRGDMVRKGQVLAIIRSGVERATMELARTRSEMEATVMARRKELEYALRNEQRVKKLHSQSAIPEREWDEVVTKRILAEYKLAAALEAKRQAQMELNRTIELVKQTTIRSTVTGIVVERFMSKGEYVDDQPIMQLAQINPLDVDVILPLQMFGAIDADMSATVKPEEPLGGEYEAKVKIVDKFIEAASGTFRIRLELPNPGNRLPFGLKCKVIFQDVPAEPPEVLKGS